MPVNAQYYTFTPIVKSYWKSSARSNTCPGCEAPLNCSFTAHLPSAFWQLTVTDCLISSLIFTVAIGSAVVLWNHYSVYRSVTSYYRESAQIDQSLTLCLTRSSPIIGLLRHNPHRDPDYNNVNSLLLLPDQQWTDSVLGSSKVMTDQTKYYTMLRIWVIQYVERRVITMDVNRFPV